ncbi:MAG: ArnT family glycosyltransferase [Bryobacteraceae bacterium]
MTGNRTDRAAAWAALGLCVLFFLSGLAVLPYPGIQNDEALYATSIYHPEYNAHPLVAFKQRIALMSMSYVGSLKGWIYAAVLRFWTPSAYSIRIPSLLGGTAAVWLFFLLLRRLGGTRVAVAGTALLAADTCFLLTTCFDWGPVVLQHLFLVAGMLSLVRFHQDRAPAALLPGFIFFGLALWDKALFGWSLVGLAAASACVFPRLLFRYLKWRNLVLAAVGFGIGAFPLILWNARSNMATLRDNASWSAQGALDKFVIVTSTADGSGLFGYISNADTAPRPREPRTALERLSVAVNGAAGRPHHSLYPLVYIAALVLLPFLWSSPARDPMLFALVFTAVTWLQMAFTQNAGGSVHHAVLLWPIPTLFAAFGLGEFSRKLKRLGKPLLAAAVAVVALSGLLVTNQYCAYLIRNGAAIVWTDAMYPLSEYLRGVRAKLIFVTDWGMMDALTLLHRGALPLREGSGPLHTGQPTAQDLAALEEMIGDPAHVLISHVDGYEVFVGLNARLRAYSEKAGYRRETLRVVHDSNGRPTFEVFRFTR